MIRHRAERIINSSCVKRSVIIDSAETLFLFFQEFLRKFSVSSSSELPIRLEWSNYSLIILKLPDKNLSPRV